MGFYSGKTVYKTLVSLIFGLIGFFSNFYTIIFPIGDYTVAVLFGLVFPLLITLAWGWRYGLLCALFGGCQTMWWLWGPSNGYAVFLAVPPFTLWIVWHGYFSGLRQNSLDRSWWLNMYAVEIAFRILATLNIMILCRWAITLNPPAWQWAKDAATVIPMRFSVFVCIKQACVGMVLLLTADVLLHVRTVRVFLHLDPVLDQKRTGHVVSLFLLIGCAFWLIDSIFIAAASDKGPSFIDLFALNIPESNLFARIVFLIACMASGLATAKILRTQRQGELSLKEAREQAVTRENFLRTLLRAIPDLVWLKDPNGAYMSCNSKFESFIGVREAELLGKTDYDYFDRELADFFTGQDRAAMEKGSARTNEEEVVFAEDGQRRHLETTKTPVFSQDHKLIGVLGIGRDITDRASLQAQLVQAQKMESVGRLAGGVAHDFNNMLSIIQGRAELMLNDLPPHHPLTTDIREIKSAAEHSSTLTRQLLAFARKQTIAPKIIDVNGAVEGILKMLRRLIGENIELVWQPSDNLWPVKVDPSQVDQLLTNLCVNARDAIENVGKITISTQNIVLDDNYSQMHNGAISGAYVLVTVSDTGCGMPKDKLDHIFEPFYTTKETGRGTGLGLAMVYGIMKQNNGFIYAYSEPGNGSIFKLYFPRQHQAPTAESSPEPKKPVPRGREAIVIVEDEPAILQLIAKRLAHLGYTVNSFSNPADAIEFFKVPQTVSLLVTDVIMPRMNGRDLAAAIARSQPDIKTLFISGYTADVIADHGILDEGINFMSKPFSIDELSLKVRQILDKN